MVKCYWPSVGSTITLTTGRVIIPRDVNTCTTRTTPSAPGSIPVTLPSHHSKGGAEGSRRTTISSTLTLGRLSVHLTRSWSVWRYSVDHRYQKVWWQWSNNFHLLTIGRTGDAGDRGGTASSGWPTRKCPGVKHSRSSGSDEDGLTGHELKTASPETILY